MVKSVRTFVHATGKKYEKVKDKVITKTEKNMDRLGYLYSKSQNALVKPLMTFEEWLNAIDEEMEK